MCKTLTRPRRNRKMNRWSERCGSFSVSSSWILRKKKKVLCYTCHQNPKTKNTMKNENIHDCLGLLIADAAALGCHWLGYRCVCASFCCSRKIQFNFTHTRRFHWKLCLKTSWWCSSYHYMPVAPAFTRHTAPTWKNPENKNKERWVAIWDILYFYKTPNQKQKRKFRNWKLLSV